VSRPDGQAPWSAVPHTVYERWVLTAAKPFPEEDAACDFDHLTRCAIHRGHEMPSARALAARWGWSADKADRLARALRKPGDPMPSRSRAEVVRRSCGGDAEVMRRSEDENVAPIAPDCGGAAEVLRMSCGGAAETVAENEPVQGVLLAPKNQEEKNQEGDKKTRAKRAGWSDEQVQQVLNEMHAIALSHNPAARPPSFATFAPKVRAAAASLRDLAKETGRSGRALIIAAWSWWWVNPNKDIRENRRGADGYLTCLRPINCPGYATKWLEREAESYVPTADEALAAVLEVGCSGAEARYPAGARCIRQTFDYAMGGDLARMRAPKDPAKMRAAWAAGFTKYLNAPALALVSR
jgi:hypothetical protein